MKRQNESISFGVFVYNVPLLFYVYKYISNIYMQKSLYVGNFVPVLYQQKKNQTIGRFHHNEVYNTGLTAYIQNILYMNLVNH